MSAFASEGQGFSGVKIGIGLWEQDCHGNIPWGGGLRHRQLGAVGTGRG